MKKGIHPLKKRINVIQTDGSFLEMYITSTYYKNHLKLDVDTRKHPCWNPHKDHSILDSSNRLQKFRHKYKL